MYTTVENVCEGRHKTLPLSLYLEISLRHEQRAKGHRLHASPCFESFVQRYGCEAASRAGHRTNKMPTIQVRIPLVSSTVTPTLGWSSE